MSTSTLASTASGEPAPAPLPLCTGAHSNGDATASGTGAPHELEGSPDLRAAPHPQLAAAAPQPQPQPVPMVLAPMSVQIVAPAAGQQQQQQQAGGAAPVVMQVQPAPLLAQPPPPPPPQAYETGPRPHAYSPAAGGLPMPAPAQPVVGEPGHLRLGAWSDGLCCCFSDCGSCLLAFFCAPCGWSTTVWRARLLPRGTAFAIFFVPWLLLVLLQLGLFGAGGPLLTALQLACTAALVALGAVFRCKLRHKYLIPGDGCQDCLAHTFCQPCARAQEARHVDRDLGLMPPA